MPERTTASIEPLFFEENIPKELVDLSVEFQRAALEFDHALPKGPYVRSQLRELVQVMNCYYSNLIEGHETCPIDIEVAMQPTDGKPSKRHPHIEEALAHIAVQQSIDQRALEDTLPSPVSLDFIKALHKTFYKGVPTELLMVRKADGEESALTPGEFRKEPSDDVKIGHHIPPPSVNVQPFMEHFSKRYTAQLTSPSSRIICIAAVHHRLNHIHPFKDGNGRVSRLVAHAMFHQAGLGVSGLWSISRGLARGLEGKARSDEYMQRMASADRLRDGDLDGRGTLSQKGLRDFCSWFLRVALDQIGFMRDRFEPTSLLPRVQALLVELYGAKEGKEAGRVIEVLFKEDKLSKSEAARWLGVTAPTARKRMEKLIRDGFVHAGPGQRDPYLLKLPLRYSDRLFPNLFPAGSMVSSEDSTPSPAP